MYIEFVIADNFLLTYLAGSMAMRLNRCGKNRLRLCVAAATGTAVAVFYPFMRLNLAGELAVKGGLWLFLCAVMFYKTPRPAISGLLFLGCTFMFGGASYAVGLMLCSGWEEAAAFSAKYPLFLILGPCALVYCGIGLCLKKLRVAHARAPYEYGTEVDIFGSKLKFAAFLDTGNCVFDERSGLPVIITDMDSFVSKLDAAASVKFAKRLPSLNKIKAKTPAGSADIYIIEPSEISVYSDRQVHKINAMIGLIGGQGKRFSAQHEMLLNPAALTEGVW